jgi:diguanylate cyclase (GGDEF)-like protein
MRAFLLFLLRLSPLLATTLLAASAVAQDSGVRPLSANIGWATNTLRVTDQKTSYPAAPALSFLEDPAGELTIQEILKPDTIARFKPVATGENQVNFGYSRSVYWLRLPIQVDADRAQDWLLEVAFPSLDRISLFQELSAGRIAEQTTGDLLPFAQRPIPHRNFVFPVRLPPRSSEAIYLRVQSAGSLTIPVTLWESRALMAADQSTYSLLSVYYGMLLALMLYNLLIYFAVNDRVFLSYVAFVCAMAIGQASLNGFGNQFLWPEFPAWGNIGLPSGMALTGMFGALFTRNFLDTRNTFPRLDRMLLGFAGLFVVAAVIPMIASYQFAAMLTSLAGLSFAIAAVGVGLYCSEKGHPGARYFLLAWSLLLLGVAVLAARNFGWVPTNGLTTYSMQIGSALEMVLLSFALSDRLSSIRREKEIATHDALVAKQRLVDSLQVSERDLERRFATRTHELETTVQSLREKEQQLGYLASHDQLTGLANRTLFYDRMAQSLNRIRRNGGCLGLVMVDIDNFKIINDQFGHAAGDAVLVAVAETMRASVRAIDTVARWGGDEFVVLLDDITSATDAETVANKLIESMKSVAEQDGEGNTRRQPGLESASISVGIATYPDHGADAHALLISADLAMYRAKTAGKNQWRWASTAPA